MTLLQNYHVKWNLSEFRDLIPQASGVKTLRSCNSKVALLLNNYLDYSKRLIKLLEVQQTCGETGFNFINESINKNVGGIVRGYDYVYGDVGITHCTLHFSLGGFKDSSSTFSVHDYSDMSSSIESAIYTLHHKVKLYVGTLLEESLDNLSVHALTDVELIQDMLVRYKRFIDVMNLHQSSVGDISNSYYSRLNKDELFWTVNAMLLNGDYRKHIVDIPLFISLRDYDLIMSFLSSAEESLSLIYQQVDSLHDSFNSFLDYIEVVK